MIGGASARPIRLELSAVIVALVEGEARLEPAVAMIPDPGAGPGAPFDLPTAGFDPDRHPTLELSLRDWVARRAGLTLGYVEQLYTFGDPVRVRAGPEAAEAPHVVSIGYLALARPQEAEGAALDWRLWREHFPYEDRRAGGDVVAEAIAPRLGRWIADAPERRAERARLCFGLDGQGWRDELSLERYELLYSARLVPEAWRDRGLTAPGDLPPLGRPLPRDHRRILATGVGRLRGKLKYRPVLFELTPPAFTLFELQRAAEAVSGVALHKQNFRRQVERSGLVEPTGASSARLGGRPAAEYRYAPEATSERRAASGRARRTGG